MQSLLRSSRALASAAPRVPARALHSASARSAAAAASGKAASAAASAVKRTGNTAADLRRIFREQQRASAVAQEAFPWEVTQQKVTAWEPKYEDEKKFHYASKVQPGKKNMDGPLLQRYIQEYGSKYLLSKRTLRSAALLPELDMTSRKRLQVELLAQGNVLNYWFLQLTSQQRPATTVKAQLESARIKTKDKQMLKVRLSRENLHRYLALLHELWPRKDERDIAWATLPRREHGQYKLTLSRVLAEGPSRPLNKATQSFIDHLVYQIGFHFKEARVQGRNLHWMQFLGVPGVKISKKWGGEIKVPKLRSRDE